MKKQTFSLRRSLIHLPVGVLAAILIRGELPIGLVFTFGWFYYEWNEDERIRDHAFLDVWGFLAGLGGAGLVLMVF